ATSGHAGCQLCGGTGEYWHEEATLLAPFLSSGALRLFLGARTWEHRRDRDRSLWGGSSRSKDHSSSSRYRPVTDNYRGLPGILRAFVAETGTVHDQHRVYGFSHFQ